MEEEKEEEGDGDRQTGTLGQIQKKKRERERAPAAPAPAPPTSSAGLQLHSSSPPLEFSEFNVGMCNATHAMVIMHTYKNNFQYTDP